MAALPANSTDRFFLEYNDGQYDHTLLVRWHASATTLSAVMASVDDLLTAMADGLYEITIKGARSSAAGSNFSFPVVWSGGASYGGGAMPGVFAPRQWTLLGRTTGGRRARFFFFGVEFDTPNSYRIPRAAGNLVDDALAVIEAGQTAGIYLCIDGAAPIMYQYADINFNNYYEAKVRG